ncbi:hypothetical protein ES703_117332 [subsurface metagenome]
MFREGGLITEAEPNPARIALHRQVSTNCQEAVDPYPTGIAVLRIIPNDQGAVLTGSLSLFGVDMLL